MLLSHHQGYVGSIFAVNIWSGIQQDIALNTN